MWTPEHRATDKDDGRRSPSDLSDAEWGTIEPLLSGDGTDPADLRELVKGGVYREKTGGPWRVLPKDFGPWQTVRWWSDRFRADGIWADLAALLTRAVRQQRGREAARPGERTHDRDPGFAKCYFQTSEREPGCRRAQEDQGHPAPCPDRLAGLWSRDPGHDGERPWALGQRRRRSPKAAEIVLDRAVEEGGNCERVTVDGISLGPRIEAAAQRQARAVHVSTRAPEATGFTPLPLRWRLEQTFGTLTNRDRGWTRNRTHDETAAEDAVAIATFHRVLRAYGCGKPDMP